MSSQQLDEEAIFHIAKDIPVPESRSGYLDQVCAGDQALRERVEALLHVHEQEQNFLNSSGEPAPTLDQPAPTEAVGQQIGRYKLLQQIGEGGFGVVYMAEQHRPVRRKVALKVIKPGMDTGAVVARFEAERQALAMMDHANISRVLDGGATESGRPYFVMELVKGVPITEYCDKNQLPTKERLELFITVCQAVQHAHQKGVIHRDIKPSNILVTLHDGQPVVKVIDFGVAKAINQQLTEKTLFTAYGQMVGTPQYMSPEQAEMSGLDVDTRSDVYSLGVLLYELLTGCTPVENQRLREAGYAEMLRIIREEEAPRLSAQLSTLGERLTTVAKCRSTDPKRLRQTLRGELDWMVLRCLEKERGRRYESASSFAADIGRYLNDEAVLACPPALTYKLRKWVIRNRALVSVGSTLLLLICLGIGGWGIATRRANIEAARVRSMKAQLLEATKERALEAAVGGDIETAARLINDAELLGAESGWVHMVRGELLLLKGEGRRAVEELEQAVRLQPDSTAAHSMLTIAASDSGDEGRYISMAADVRDMPALSFADKLFKGRALFRIYTSVGIEELNKAVKHRPQSPVARLFRSRSLTWQALNTGETSDVKRAVEDADLALAQMPDAPVALQAHVDAHLAASLLYPTDDVSERHEELAEQSVAQLERFPMIEAERAASANFYEVTEQFDALLEVTQLPDNQSEQTSYLAFHRAAEFFSRGDYEAALDAYESARTREKGEGRWVEMYILQDRPGPEVHSRQQQYIDYAKGITPYHWHLLFDWTALRLMQHEYAEPMAEMFHSRFVQDGSTGWQSSTDYMRSDGTDAAIARSVDAFTGSRFYQSSMLLMVGIDQLARGHRRKAVEQFSRCRELGNFKTYAHYWSRVFLQKLEDPNWPPWLPVVDD